MGGGGGEVPNVRRAGGLVSRVFFLTRKPLDLDERETDATKMYHSS